VTPCVTRSWPSPSRASSCTSEERHLGCPRHAVPPVRGQGVDHRPVLRRAARPAAREGLRRRPCSPSTATTRGRTSSTTRSASRPARRRSSSARSRRSTARTSSSKVGPDHPSSTCSTTPTSSWTAASWIHLLVTYMGLTGHAPIEIVKPRAAGSSAHPDGGTHASGRASSSSSSTPGRGGSSPTATGRSRATCGAARPSATSAGCPIQMTYLRWPNPVDRWYGQGHIQAVRHQVMAEEYARAGQEVREEPRRPARHPVLEDAARRAAGGRAPEALGEGDRRLPQRRQDRRPRLRDDVPGDHAVARATPSGSPSAATGSRSWPPRSASRCPSCGCRTRSSPTSRRPAPSSGRAPSSRA
jgi:hypothetical protein